MFTNIMKKIMMFSMLLALALYAEPAFARGGGGGFHGGGGGFHGGGGSHSSGFRNGGFREDGGFRGTDNMGMRNDGFRSDNPARDMSAQSFHNGSFNNGMSFRGNTDGHFATRDFDRDRGHFFGHDRDRFFDGDRGRFFDHDFDHDRDFFHHHHHHFFFNPFFDFVFFDPFFYTGCFYNPYYYGYYGPPYYYYDYYYPWNGTGYATVPGNSYTYNYYSNPNTNTTQTYGNAASPTPAENYFKEGVRMFGNGNYSFAAEKFGAAKSLVPQDKVLPFAYAQAVFANGDYIAAAAAVREAVAKVNPETEGIFYPRGMYQNEATLQQQIKTLAEAARLSGNNSSLQLLLGYNELGMGNLDKAEVALNMASADPTNGPTAKALLKMVNKLRTIQTQAPKTQSSTPENTAPQIPKEESPAY